MVSGHLEIKKTDQIFSKEVVIEACLKKRAQERTEMSLELGSPEFRIMMGGVNENCRLYSRYSVYALKLAFTTDVH
ncbi:hypothetical protein BpHYR1_033220 [Brachionus plicatilis]|uniref:Uncharacterized protein n=1 Tax=Brachionus plicatilis TaxID=10195 RepID=A0A3M7T7X2_BRAPC|nr:hypothetical protein BpHYR1_033220 [Brachionus plicatilis]